MSRLSNSLIGIINTLTFLVSVPILFVSVLWYIHGPAQGGGPEKTECIRTTQLPILIFAAILFTISLIGMIGSCCKVSSFLWTYLAVMFLLILGLICFTIFTIVISTTRVDESVYIDQAGLLDKGMVSYSPWLSKHITGGRSWQKIKSCMVAAKVCHGFDFNINHTIALGERLNPIQATCCMPPISCGLTFINKTFWEATDKSPKPIGECTAWSNNEDILCYNCESCKEGVLEIATIEGKNLTKFNISILVFLIIVYIITCCAYKSNRSEQYKGYSYP